MAAPARPASPQRVLVCALAAGLLSAAALGVGTSGGGGVNQSGASAAVETTFSPGGAAVGFVAAAPVGALAGALWGRGGVRGVIGVVLVVLACGSAGLLAAGLVGARTRVSVTTNAVEVDYGPPVPVLVGGAAVGTALGALAAWRLGPRPAAPAGGLCYGIRSTG